MWRQEECFASSGSFTRPGSTAAPMHCGSCRASSAAWEFNFVPRTSCLPALFGCCRCSGRGSVNSNPRNISMPPMSADSYRQHRASHVEFPATSIRPSMDQTSDSSIGALRSRVPLPPKTLIGFLLAVIAVVIITLLSYQSLQVTNHTARNLAQSVEMLARLQGLLSTLKDAETGQRGYLLTGEESYLSPYTDAKDALPGEFKSIR